MASHLDFVRSNMNGAVIRAATEAIGKAVVVTDGELIVGKAGIFGRWGGRLERFELSDLQQLESSPNPTAHRLSLQFSGGRLLMLMFGSDSRSDFPAVISALQSYLDKRTSGARQ